MIRVLGVDPGSSHVGMTVLDIGDSPTSWVSQETMRPEEFTPATFSTYKSGCDVYMVAIEAPVGRTGPWVGPVVQTALIAGEIFGICKTLGMRPQYVLCKDWRKMLCGKGNASDAEVKEALSREVCLPVRTNAHVRDAAGVALVAGRLAYNGVFACQKIKPGVARPPHKTQ